jgi:hypothetical protein
MVILNLSLSAILFGALGAMVAAYVVIGAVVFLLGLIVLASQPGQATPPKPIIQAAGSHFLG